MKFDFLGSLFGSGPSERESDSQKAHDKLLIETPNESVADRHLDSESEPSEVTYHGHLDTKSPERDGSIKDVESRGERSSLDDESVGTKLVFDPAPDGLSKLSHRHQSIIGPSSIDHRINSIGIGTEWTRTLWITEFPEIPVDGLFEGLYSSSDTRTTDFSIHLQPRDRQSTLDALKRRLESLEADVEYLSRRSQGNARGSQKDLEDYQTIYDTLRNTTMRAYDVSMFLTIRGSDPSSLNIDGVMKTALQAPANLTPVLPRWTQLDAFISTSPMASNRLGLTTDTSTPMLAGGIGAMFPFVAGAFAESGIEFGSYALNQSPLIVDRFNRETGYCMMVIGKLGAGKSFSTKLQLLRRAMFDPETIIVMLDPLDGFAGINEILGGERMTVGGTRGFNPLDLEATPEAVLSRAPDLDPWAEQIAWVLTFFDTFFTHIAGNPLGNRKQTLRRAVQEAYEQKGITRDPQTHRNESPTIPDVMTIIEDMVDNATDYGYLTKAEQKGVASDAQSLLKDLRPSFRIGGDLENLAGPTEFDLDSDVIYLDLTQEEGRSGANEMSLMMQVVFNAVYERVKQTEKKVIFVIDEAHYLMTDSTSLEFLETAVRHSRHYDLSLQFITQTGGEFSLTPEARTIADLCSIRLIHRANEQAEKLASWFDLSEREVNWIRTAKAGNEDDGFSEALLGIDEEGWFPIRVRASEYEADLISRHKSGT